jgi:hypothetical protein
MSDNVADVLASEADDLESRWERGEEIAARLRPARPPRDPSQVYSLRMPVDRLGTLRRIADEQGVNPTALMRSWVLERLAQEEREEGQRQLVDEMRQLVAHFRQYRLSQEDPQSAKAERPQLTPKATKSRRAAKAGQST